MPLDLPPPPRTSFASDNTAGADPAVLAALADANEPAAPAYGGDRWTRAADDRLRELLGVDARVLWAWGGTGANVVALGSLLRPWQAVLCPGGAHIVADEAGAPGRFVGCSLVPVDCPDGKLTAARLASVPALGWRGSVHHPQPAVVSISQATELGTVYRVEELRDLCAAAHDLGLVVHVDGARLANAAAALQVGLRELVTDTGVDVLGLGMTKNGALHGEAVVFLRPELAPDAAHVQKQAAQLASKNRFLAAQALALLEDDRWLRNGAHANAMARRLADAVRDLPGLRLAGEPEANAVFAHLPAPVIPALQAWSHFWVWDEPASLVRWMTSFATTEADVDAFAAGVAGALAAGS